MMRDDDRTRSHTLMMDPAGGAVASSERMLVSCRYVWGNPFLRFFFVFGGGTSLLCCSPHCYSLQQAADDGDGRGGWLQRHRQLDSSQRWWWLRSRQW